MAYIPQIKVMVPVHVLIPQRGNMLPYMMDFTYVIKDFGKKDCVELSM